MANIKNSSGSIIGGYSGCNIKNSYGSIIGSYDGDGAAAASLLLNLL